MAEISLNLGDLFEQAFGYKTRAFDPKFDWTNRRGQEQGKAGAPFYTKDAMGREYFMPVTVSYPDTGVASSPPSGITGNAGSYTSKKSWQLPYPVISIESAKIN